MPTRAERLLKWLAAVSGLLTLVALGLSLGGDRPSPAGWATLAFLYLTGVSYGLGDMARLFQRHRRRCRECLDGAGPHLRWWSLRVLLVLLVSTLPVLLLLPVLGAGD